MTRSGFVLPLLNTGGKSPNVFILRAIYAALPALEATIRPLEKGPKWVLTRVEADRGV